MRSAASIAAIFVSAFISYANATEESKGLVEVAVWAGPNAGADSRVVRIYEHLACSGKVALIRVDRMPAPQPKATLELELVVELAHGDKVVRRWGMPVDAVVAAVSGDRIIVPASEASVGAKAFSISTTGAIGRTTVPNKADFGKSIECPHIKEFGDSAYLRCFEFRDLASSQLRRIAYQAPCT